MWDDKVAVILPTLNEAAYISNTLDSLYSQSYREFTLIVCDSQSNDETKAIAKEYGCVVMEAPRGKLTARDLAIRSTTCDIVVSVDADTFYPETWLQDTIAVLKIPRVVGVTGPRLFNWVGRPVQKLYNDLRWRFYGSNSAFWKCAYNQVGGFNLQIDQRDPRLMVEEEEIRFKQRLQQIGLLIYQPYNPVFTSSRRFATNQAGYNTQRYQGLRF